MTTSIVTPNPAPVKPPPKGRLPGPCVCGGALRYACASRQLTCRKCGLDITLTAEEHQEVLWYQAMPRLQDVPFRLYLPALLAAHHCYAANVEPEPQVISTRDSEGWKVRVLPEEGETDADRAVRLEAQANLNSVIVRPINTALTEFAVSSQRRDAAGCPVRWYTVTITPFRAKCSCPAPNDSICAHIAATHACLLNEQERERANAQERIARGAAAIAEMWG